ncbi:MAG: thioredoxin 1 [Paraburkholderia sp.]|nr:thioredoxin 1 [Paraburkholderia sp.]
MTESIIETSAATFEADVLHSPLPVLIDFWAPWCGPCREIEPLIKRIATEYAGRLRVVRYNIDDSKDTWKTFDLRGIPALRLYRGGREVGRPLLCPSSLWRALDAALANDTDAGEQSHLSFGGDAQRKAQCIARLQKAIATGQLAKRSPNSPLESMRLDGAHLPSVHAAGGPRERYADVLGVPPVLGQLHDLLFEMLPSAEGRDTRFAVEWVAAMPVGSDLGGVAQAYAHWLMNDRQWGLAAHQPEITAATHGDEVEILNVVRALWQAVLDLHRLQGAGRQPPDLTKWQALDARAIELLVSLNGKENLERTPRFIQAMRLTMAPQITVDALSELIGEIIGLCADRFAATWWSDAENALLASRRDAVMKRVAELGERPSDAASLDAWWQQASSISKQLSAEFDATHPALVARRDAMVEAGLRLHSDLLSAHAGFLLTRLQGTQG